jgi:hypothetical protein
MRLTNRAAPNPIAINVVLEIPRFGWETTSGTPPWAADAHPQADDSWHTIPVLRRKGRNKSLNAARAKKPPTGVTIRTTFGKVSGSTEKPITVPKPKGSRRNASKIRAAE